MHSWSATFSIFWLWISHRRFHAVWFYPGTTTATLCYTALPLAPSTSCSEYRTMPQESFIKYQDDHTRIHCWRNYTGCRWSSASLTSWPCWRSEYDRCQHQHISLTVSLSLYINLCLKLTYLILHTANWPALPVPLKLWHYGAIQMYQLLLLLLLFWTLQESRWINAVILLSSDNYRHHCWLYWCLV